MLIKTTTATCLFAILSGWLQSPVAPEATANGGESNHTPHADWKGAELPQSVHRGLEFLIAAQAPDGGYGQDGRDPRTGVALESEGRDVANTAMVALTLLRTGTTPETGPYTDQLLLSLDFILDRIEAAPEEGLAITDREGTQIQRKLGRYIDTFLASMLLAELKGQMPDEIGENRVGAALQKCVRKIEGNQQQDGSWNAGGWAPILSTSMASRSLDAAKSKGVKVDADVLERAEGFAGQQFDEGKGEFRVGRDDAGIALYKVASVMEQASREPGASGNRAVLGAAEELLDSTSFQEGFGSMGGEEFLSYMNISDSLRRTGGEKWQKWNRDIQQKLTQLQNADGSWAGHHCITGRIACTASAIMTMMSERMVARPQ